MSNSRRVLIVEDTQSAATIYHHMIEAKVEGSSVTCCLSSEYALDELRENEYDLILMDLQLPNISGHELLRIIKKENLSRAPIIATTAHFVSMNDREKYIAEGFDDFLPKTSSIDAIVAMVKKHLA
jgi:two-component system, OmpR family, aerobic respiration control sensor histidine kinase ArcB